MWKSIGVAIVLLGVMLINTPVVAQTTSEDACLSSSNLPLGLKISVTTTQVDTLKVLIKTLCAKGIKLSTLQLEKAIEYGSSEVSRKSSLSIFPPKKSLTTITISYDEVKDVWNSKTFTSVRAEKGLQGFMIVLIITVLISGAFGKSLMERPASFGIAVGIIAGLLAGTVVSPSVAISAGGLAGLFVGAFAGGLAGLFVGAFNGLFNSLFVGASAIDFATSRDIAATLVFFEWIVFCVSLIALEFIVYNICTLFRKKVTKRKNEPVH